MLNTLAPTSTPAGSANRKIAQAGRTVLFRVLRCDGPGKPSRWEEFKVPVPPGANVISCLQHIAANPVTTAGVRTTPVVWDSGCLEEVCGACTMVINGKVRQSCSCLIDDHAPREGDVITLEPMSKFPIIRDLWVDRERLFHNLRRVRAWVPIDGTYSLGAGPRENPDTQGTRYKLSECMSCGCCLEACPQFNHEASPESWDTAFVGAHAISQARLFNMHETGKVLAGERLDELAGPGGVNECGNAQNCVKVCPKHIPLTESIAAMGRAVTIHAVKKFFLG
ncbi:MAG: succinate dehydrogenase iron-sulfur subunit [Phycisphaeraceae bacterium]|nr:succinate dehydrogenase iron-sulfur subunit [Phycisphaeraceae bacterium]MBX3409394.1 succinate dehydrogenase iron-sulfur subunit [Phycisphaeraceae bacterium]